MKGIDVNVIGFDSETLQGPPITFQFSSKQAKISSVVFIGEKESAVKVFLREIGKLKPGRYRMYGHNLEFDMLSVLWEVRGKIRDGNIDLKIGSWNITGRYSKPIFAVFEDGKRYIELVDSILWFQTSLDRAARIVCPELPKLVRPPGLGTTRYKKTDTTFIKYALRDAEVAYYIGLAIERFHEELQIPAQISLASMAAAVFKQHYMRSNIYQPPLYNWMVGSAAAYHGGVNRIRPNTAPAWHKNVTALDLSSAYPDAMHKFPAFNVQNAYQRFKVIKGKLPTKVPELGCYKISGRTDDCDWPALFDHNFKPIQGNFSEIWVNGFELNEAIRADEVSIKKIDGFYYDRDMEADDYSPFKNYVDTFYDLKSSSKDAVLRYMYKILLNALTGKFIQTSPDYTLVDGQLVKINRAGGLYHPFIAGNITGHTRSVMHGMEHKYEAIHTATDGIFAPGTCKGAKEKTLGSFVSEGTGDLALFRNKLYIFYTDESADGAYASEVFKGRYIQKCARHGFQGSIVNLEQMLVNNNRTYNVNKPIKLKTAIQKGDVPNKFVISQRKLNINEEFKVFDYG